MQCDSRYHWPAQSVQVEEAPVYVCTEECMLSTILRSWGYSVSLRYVGTSATAFEPHMERYDPHVCLKTY